MNTVLHCVPVLVLLLGIAISKAQLYPVLGSSLGAILTLTSSEKYYQKLKSSTAKRNPSKNKKLQTRNNDNNTSLQNK